MKISYYINIEGREVLFCICEEGSTIDLAIKRAKDRGRKIYTKAVNKAIQQRKAIPPRNRDILEYLKKATEL